MNKDFRAKQFLPFDALNGLQEALRKKEIEYIPKKELSEELKEEIGCILSSLDIGENIKITYYNMIKQNRFPVKKDSIMNDNKENNSALRDEYPEQETEFTASLSDARPSDISKNNEVTRKKLMKTALSGAIRYTAMLACFLVFLGAAGYVASYAIQYMEKVQESAYFDKLGDGRIKTMMAGMAASKLAVTSVVPAVVAPWLSSVTV